MKVSFTKVLVLMLVSVVILSKPAKAQFKDKFFFSNGFSIYTDLIFGKKIVPVYYEGYSYDGITEGADAFGASIFTYTPNFRYNLTEFDANSSLSLNVPLGIGMMISEFGFGSLEIPIYLAYNSGNISTYSSDKNKGFTIGLGFEYFNMALFKNSDYDLDTKALESASWVSPCMNIGYRYWNKRNVAREFNLKLGFGPSSSYEGTDATTGNAFKIDEGSPLSVKLTWFRYLNY